MRTSLQLKQLDKPLMSVVTDKKKNLISSLKTIDAYRNASSAANLAVK
jgi:hypothetical protein